MKLLHKNTVLLQEKEYKPKKGEPEGNIAIVWEATVIQSLDERLKKGDKVLINRMGLMDIPAKKKLILLDIEDVLVKL